MTCREVRRYMLKEINAAVDPRTFLHEKRDLIENAMGIRVSARGIDRLIILTRIPGYDFFLHRADRATGFEEPVTVGWAIWGRVIYIGVNRTIVKTIEKYGLGNLAPDSAEVRQQVERLIRLVCKFSVHEFAHILHAKHMEMSMLGLGQGVEFMQKLDQGIIDVEVENFARTGLARIPFKELVAFGTTMVVLGEQDPLEGLSDQSRDWHSKVVRQIEEMRFDNLGYRSIEKLVPFFLENRHDFAIRFLTITAPTFGSELVRFLLARPPTFDELIHPELYCQHHLRGGHTPETR